MRFLRRSAPLLALLIFGCSTHLSSPPLSPSYSPSRDGGLHYRLPAGWFDATADSQSAGHAVLIIRNDYGATIAIDEVHLDGAAREHLRQGGLLEAAQVLMSLSTWDRGTVLVQGPRLLTLAGKEVCRYTMAATAARDQIEVTLLDTGGKMYAVNVLLSGKAENRAGVFEQLQDDFVGSLRW